MLLINMINVILGELTLNYYPVFPTPVFFEGCCIIIHYYKYRNHQLSIINAHLFHQAHNDEENTQTLANKKVQYSQIVGDSKPTYNTHRNRGDLSLGTG